MKAFNQMINSILILLVLYTSLSAPVIAQDKNNSLFWSVSTKHSEYVTHIFGTMHVIPKAEFEKFQVVDKKLQESDLLVMEMDINIPMKEKMTMAQKMMLPEGKEIPDFMDENEYESIRSYALDSLKIKKFLFNTYIKMKPFAFYSALIPHAVGGKIESYEMHFSNIAKKRDIPVHGLETFDFQMGIFDSIPNNKQLEMFFDEIPDLQKEMDKLITIYKSQDIEKMALLLQEEGGEYAELEEELLLLRNRKWVDQLEKLLPEQACFIAVGAAHLGGKNGILQLLREKGYTVEPASLYEE